MSTTMTTASEFPQYPSPSRSATTRRRIAALTALTASVALVVSTGGPAIADEAKPVQARPLLVKTAATPHKALIMGNAFVRGSVKVRFKTQALNLLGKSGNAHLVRLPYRVVKISKSGKVTTLLRHRQNWFTLSEDGVDLYGTRFGDYDRTRIRAINPRTGKTRKEISRKGTWSVVAGRDQRAMLSEVSRGTVEWNRGTGKITRLSKNRLMAAGYGANRLSLVIDTGGQYPCSEVTTSSRLMAKKAPLWKSCDQMAAGFSPDGSKMITFDVRTDGIGPGQVQQRTSTGHLLARYNSGWFGSLEWAPNGQPLMTSTQQKTSAWVRCSTTACVRVSPTWHSDF